MKKDLTVVLTLRDRTPFTYRWLKWMNEQRFPYRILIADGGSREDFGPILTAPEYCRNLDIEYIRYPYDKGISDYLEKMADISNRIKTEYVLAADNDDFILSEPLESNLELIRNHPEIRTLGPAQLRFKINSSSSQPDDLLSSSGRPVIVSRLRSVTLPGLESAEPMERLLTSVEKFHSAYVWYGLHRTQDYRRINTNVKHMAFSRFIFQEWYALYSHAISGKILLDKSEPFLMRQEDTSQAASKTYFQENHSMIFLHKDWSEQLYKMIGQLFADYVNVGGHLSAGEFEQQFKESFRKHMLNFMQFRGYADRLRNHPLLFSIGKSLIARVRGTGNPLIPRKALVRNKAAVEALEFLSSYNTQTAARFSLSDVPPEKTCRFAFAKHIAASIQSKLK